MPPSWISIYGGCKRVSSAGSLKPRSSDISRSATQSLLHECLSEVRLNLSRTLVKLTSVTLVGYCFILSLPPPEKHTLASLWSNFSVCQYSPANTHRFHSVQALLLTFSSSCLSNCLDASHLCLIGSAPFLVYLNPLPCQCCECVCVQWCESGFHNLLVVWVFTVVCVQSRHVFLSRPLKKRNTAFPIVPSFANISWGLELKVYDFFSCSRAQFCLQLPAKPLPKVSIWIVLTQTIKLHRKGHPTWGGVITPEAVRSLECFISFTLSNDDVSERSCFQRRSSLHCWLISFVTRCESRYLFCLRLDEKAPRRWMISLICCRSGCSLQTETNSRGTCGGQRYICTRRHPTCKTMLHSLLLTMPY